MDETEALKIFMTAGALREGHFVYKSGRHGNKYFNWKPEMAREHIEKTDLLCSGLAAFFPQNGIDAVIGPATGGMLIAQIVRHYLRKITGDKVLAFYMEKESSDIILMQYNRHLYHDINSVSGNCAERLGRKRVLVVDDVLTTGESVRRVVGAVRAHGGDPVAVGVLCNRGGVTRKTLGVHELQELVALPLESSTEEECLLCRQHVPVNTKFGHGMQFLEKMRERQAKR